MLSLIVGMSENRVIGRDGDMPWRMSNDLRRFKRLTMGHHIVMGRKTYDSIGRPLPGRTSVVLSRSAEYDDPQVRVARSMDDVLAICADDPEAFVIGGAEIYRLALPIVDRCYVTKIHCKLTGDTFFPEVDWGAWRLCDESRHASDDKNQYEYSFLTYDRTRNE